MVYSYFLPENCEIEENEKNVTLPPNRLKHRCAERLKDGKCLANTSPTLPHHFPVAMLILY